MLEGKIDPSIVTIFFPSSCPYFLHLSNYIYLYASISLCSSYKCLSTSLESLFHFNCHLKLLFARQFLFQTKQKKNKKPIKYKNFFFLHLYFRLFNLNNINEYLHIFIHINKNNYLHVLFFNKFYMPMQDECMI